MKHKLLLPLLLLLVWAGAPRAGAQNLSWQGVINTSPSGGDGVTQPFTNVRSASSVMDASGNIIFTGNFFGTATFGSTTLTTGYNSTAYMAKWSPSTSTWLWAISGGGQNASFERVAVSGTNLYVAGTFTNSITLGGSTQSSPGFNGLFVAKYTDNGSGAPTFGWMRVGQGVSDSGTFPNFNNDATTIAVTGVGVSGSNVYVGGNFRSRGTFTVAGMGIQSNSAYDDDYFVAKFVDNGTSAGNGWAIRSGGDQSDAAAGMAVSGSNIYLCGTFFTRTTHGTNTFTTSGSSDNNIILVKYVDNGTSASVGWALSEGGTRGESGSSLVVSGSSIYMGGTFATSTTIAGTSLSTTNTPSGSAMFVAKYIDNGPSVSGKWAIGSTAGTGSVQVRGIALSGTNVFATGAYFGTMTVAGSSLTATNNSTAAEIYVARFIDNTTSAAGGTALSAGTTGIDVGSTVEAAGSTAYVLGSAKNGATFGSNSISAPNTTGNCTFIARASVPGSNTAPTDLALSNSSVAENAGANATVGTFSTTDPNAGNTFTYSLVTGSGDADNGSFNISGSTLRLTASADYETKNSYSIRVRVADQGGLTYDEAFTISISDVNETPTVTNFTPNTGQVGTAGIVINGTNFTSAGAVTVKFNGTTATTVTVNSNTQLTATVPAGATTGPISVQNADGTGSSSGDFTVTQTADLGVTLSDSPDPVSEGAQLTYTLGVNNAGPSAASSVTATLSLPAGAVFVSAAGTGWSCSQAGSTVTATRPTLATGAAPGITVQVLAPGQGGSITATATVASSTTDPANVNNTATAATTVLGVNDAPVNTVPGPQTTAEDVAKVFSTANGNAISVDDVDVGAGNLELTLTASNGNVTLSRLTGLTFSTGDGTADATVKFQGTPANVNAALNGLSFQPAAGYNGTAAALAVVTNDLGNTGSGGAKSDSDNISITVTAVNDAPVVTTSGGSTTWSQGGAAVAVDGGLTVADVDNTTLASATVSITAGFQSGADVLTFLNTSSTTYGNIVGSYANGTGTLTLTSAGAAATLAQWQSALRVVSFTNTAGSPTTTNRTLSFVANDGTASSVAATKTVTIQLRTATPAVNTPADNSSTNDATPSYSGTAAGGSTVTLYVDGNNLGTTTANNGNGSWTLTPSTVLTSGSHTVYVTAQSSGLAVSLNSNTNTFTIDTTAPTVSISSTAGPAGSSTGTSPIPFTVTFSESVTGFVANEVTVTGGALTSGSFSGSGTTYTFTVTPSAAGAVTVNVAANAAQDQAGNNSTAAAQFSINYVTATVSSVTGLTPTPTATAAVSYRVVFSQSMTGVSADNFSLTAPGLTGANIASVTGAGTTYTVLVNTGAGDGTLRLNVQNSTGLTPTVTGLPYTSGAQYTITKTFTNPVLTIQGAGGAGGTNNDVTAFVDQVQLLQSGTPVSGVANGSFETYNPLANGSWGYNPTGASWTFAAYTGIAQNGSAFSPAPAPDGIAVGVIQTANGTNGQIQQTLTPANGNNYQLRFLTSQRNCCSTNDQQLDVFINSVYLGSIRPTDTNGYTAFTSENFSVIAPTIASFAPNPAGVGIPVTLTGSNLGGASSLTINGAAATILSNTATSVTARVPAGATATGSSRLTTASGTISSTAFTFLPAPGNALALDGTDDYVSVPHTAALNLGASFTIEAWIKPTGTGNAIQSVVTKSSNTQNTGFVFPRTDDTWQNLRIWLHRGGSWSQYTVPFGAAYLGKWHHVAATYDGTTVRMYIDGVAQTPTVNGTVNTGPVTSNTNPLTLGTQVGYNEYYRGGLDEVRLYNAALSQAQVQADMLSTAPAVPASLVSYYNFDEGTPGGVNPGLTTLYDVAATNHGTLSGFTGLGTANATSNWVESYALVVPTATDATAVTLTSFTANWTAPALGTVDNYLLDVSTSSTFASVISGSPFTVAAGTTSRPLAGLTAGTTYYYRVRADKNSVTGQGAPSNVITVACPVPVATTQPVSVALTSAATATVTAAQVNNGSTANCGVATTLQLRKTGVSYGLVSENQSLTLTAPAGAVFVAVDFASYGTPTGTTGNYTLGSCHGTNSVSVVQGLLLGNNSATIVANNATFGAPCSATPKYLAVRATYAFPAAPQLTFGCAEIGANPVQLLVTDAYSRVSTAAATVTVTQPATPTTTWSGAVSALTTDCGNWSFGKVPDAATNVVVPAGLSRYPTLSGPLAAKDVTIAAGASFTLGSGATLQVNGSWTNNGTATLGGTVSFVGAAAQTIGGSSPSSFAGLSVGKTGGSLTLQRNAAVTSALTLGGGVLTTGSYELTTTGATLAETSSSYVLGNVVSTMSLTAAGTRYDFGGLGLALTPSGATLPGSTVVRRVTGTALTGQLGRQSIQRYYDIQPTVNAGLNVAVEFGYFPTELNGIDESDLSIYRSTTGLSGPWQPVPFASQNTTAHTITATGVEHFSVWTLGSRATPLPVTLARFTAERQGPDALLRWTTAQEKNNAYFEVESSADGRTFRPIGRVTGQGTSTTPHDYQLPDRQLSRYAAPVVYYRLRQVDTDGTATLSAVRTVAVPAETQLSTHPNPARTATQLRGTEAHGRVQLFDAVGRLVAETRADAAGTATLALPQGLPAGVYLVRAGAQTLRLVVE